MDKRKGLINVVVSIVFRVLLLIGNLLVRRYLIKFIGNEANGIDSLFTSIVGFLAVAELGVGSAITFCMYKPIVEGDNEKVSALFCLFRKLYLIIGSIILISGFAVMFFLPYLAKDYAALDVNLYLTFGLMLFSVVLSYAFSAEISLINAYKNNYISTSINSSALLLQYVLQIIVLVLTQSLNWYFACRVFAVLAQWIITEIITFRKHKEIIVVKKNIDKDTKAEVTKNVKAMFMHKIGGILVNTADSVIISAFIGVVILGKYTNYTVIMTAMIGTISLFFTPLTSIIGHMYLDEDRAVIQKYYNFFCVFNYIIGIIFFLGYYSVIDNIITICFGDGLIMSKATSFIITLNYFIQFMRQSTALFRDATGTFYYDRWKPLVEGIINIVLSVSFVYLFAYFWGEDFAVVGVIVATIITNLFICHIVEPHVLYKYALKTSAKKYYIRNYLYIAIFTALLFALHFSMISSDNQWVELFANGGISIAFSFGISALIILSNKDFRHYLKNFIQRFIRREKSQPECVSTQSDVNINEPSVMDGEREDN